MTKVCKRCLYTSSHPLGLDIDEEGICSGCRIHEEKDSIDWVERLNELRNLVAGYKSQDSQTWDCIVPVSGGRDSFFIVDTVKNVLGLNPLLVTYNRHYNSRAGIENITRLRTELGCDIITQTLRPSTVLKVIQASLEKCGSVHWHSIAGQTVFPVWTAVRYKIPLIIWGHHQGLDQVGMYSHHDRVEMTKRYRLEHDLMGVGPEDLIGAGPGLTEEELSTYTYPSDRLLLERGVRGIYLGNYLRWDTLAQHRLMKAKYNYYTGPLKRTFDECNDVDCEIFTNLHDVIKYRKWGYTKLTDDLCREIRFGRVSKDEAQNLVNSIDPDTFPKAVPFLDRLDLSEGSLEKIIDRHRSPVVWKRSRDGMWVHHSPLKSTSGFEESSLGGLRKLNPTASRMAKPYDEQMLTQGQGERLY